MTNFGSYYIISLIMDKNFLLRARTRLLIIVLFTLFALALTAALLPYNKAAFADETYYSSGSGTGNDPYIISTPAELVYLSDLVNSGTKRADGKMYSALAYRLNADLDMAGISFSPIGKSGASPSLSYYIEISDVVRSAPGLSGFWVSANFNSYFYVLEDGEYVKCSDTTSYAEYDEILFASTDFYYYYQFETAFFGTFDGNGHTISHLSVSEASDCAGLFGYAVNAEIKNLILENASVSGSSDAGIIAGNISSSVISNCAVVTSSASSVSHHSSGGVAAVLSSSIKYTADLGGYSYNEMEDYLYPYINTPRAQLVSNCAVIGGEFIGAYAGGIVGFAEEGAITDCFSSATVTAEEGGFKGCLVGSLVSPSNASYCLGVSGSLFGKIETETEEETNFSHCIYPSDILSDALVDCSLTTENILTSATELLSDSWNVFENDGTTYYYPSPVSYARQNLTAYSVSIDGAQVALINSLTLDGAIYVLPDGSLDGYNFEYYEIGGVRKNAGETVSLSGDVSATLYRSLIAPISSDLTVEILRSNKVYSGEEFLAASSSYSDPYMREFTLQWYKLSPDGLTYSPVSSAHDALNLTRVSDSGSYFCRATVIADGNVNLVSENAVYVDSDVFDFTVSPKPATVDISASSGGFSSVPFTGSAYPIDFSCLYTDVIDTDESAVSVSNYALTLNGAPSEARLANTYLATAAVSHPDYVFTVRNGEFTVTPAPISATLTGYNGLYDGKNHSATASDFTFVGSPSYKIEYSLDNETYFSDNFEFTSVTDSTVFVRITAPDHEPFVSSVSIVIAPLPVTVTAAESYEKPSKIYDFSTAFPVSSIDASHYTLSYGGDFDGTCPITVTSVTSSSPNCGETVSAVVFAIDSENFVLTNSSIVLNSVIRQGTVTIVPNGALSAVYRGGTDYINAIKSEDYEIISDSSVTPLIGVYSAVSDSPRVKLASSLTVKFSISGTNFVFENGTGEYVFEFSLTPKKLTVDPSLVHAVNRDYDGTTAVEVYAESGATVGAVSGDDVSFTVSSAVVSSPEASEEAKAVTILAYSLNSDDYYIDISEIAPIAVLIGKTTPEFTPVPSEDAVYSSSVSLPSLSYRGSVDGVIEWLPLHTDEKGVIDLNYYEVSAENTISFGYVFTPTDSVNYKTYEGSFPLNFVVKAAYEIEVTYLGKTVFEAFEKIDVSFLSVYALYNDGDRVLLSPGSGGYNVSYPDERNSFYAGDLFFTVSYTAKNGVFSKDVSVTVNKIVIDLPVSSPSYEYNGLSRTYIPSSYVPSLMSISDNVQTNAGNYAAILTLTETAFINYRFDNENGRKAEAPWAITPLKKSCPFLETNSYVYTGDPIAAVVRNDYNSTSDFFTVSGDVSAIDAGDYTLTVSLISKNYYWTELNHSDSLVFTWKILPVVVTRPVIYYDAPFVYDGEVHSLIVDENPAYTLSGDLVWTNASSYVVYAALNDVKNYVWDNQTTETVTLTYEVAKQVVAKPVFTTTYIYSGKAYALNVNELAGYSVSGTTRAVNAGQYSFTLTLTDENNRIWSDGESSPYVVEWRISPIYVSLPSVAGTSRYTGSAQEALITADSVYCRVTNNVATVVGSYVATVSLIDKRNTLWANGTSDDISVNWEIAPAVTEIPSAPENVLYNGIPQTAFIPIDSSYVVSGNVQKDAGVYTITVTLRDKANYVWSDGTTSDKTFEWKICRVTLSSDGESSPLEAYAAGTPLSSPYKDGYTFDGWYLSPDFTGEKVESISEIDGDITLYAKWVENKTSSNGGTETGSKLSEKAIIGIALGGGAFVIALLIVVLGIVLKRGSGGGRKRRNPHDIL